MATSVKGYPMIDLPSVTEARTGAVVLAAGKGTRMACDTPKVLVPMLEEPLLRYVYDSLDPLGFDRIWTVVGYGADAVRTAFPGREDGFVLQEEQRGTGHALMAAWKAVLATALDYVLVINGDTPLAPSDALAEFVSGSVLQGADIAFLTLTPRDPGALGRVLREDGAVKAIVEAKDYDEALHGPDPGEINAGIYCLKTQAVTDLLPLLRDDNKSGELYITDLVGLGVERGLSVVGLSHGDDPTLLGINTPAELVRSEELVRERIVGAHLAAGAFVRNPSAVRIGPGVAIAPGADITGPCELYGTTRIGPCARVESHCRIVDSEVAQGGLVRAFSHLEGAFVGPGAQAGPYARLRTGAALEEGAKAGNFVEVKKSVLHKGAKVNHLAYIGDADVGAGANVGAGTITCNYDGVNKHATRIGEKAFIGSNSALVAPVSIGDGALVGAGSVITRDVPDGHLALTRAPQKDMPRRGKG